MAASRKQVGGRAVSYLSVRRGRPPASYWKRPQHNQTLAGRETNRLDSTFARLIASTMGMPCWQVRWDGNVGLDLNFGPPRLIIREPRAVRTKSARVRAVFTRRSASLNGSHWLVCQPGVWRLTLRDGTVVRNSSSVRRLNQAVAKLRGEMLVGVAVHALTGRTFFAFDLGGLIEVRRRSRAELAPDEELWSLSSRTRWAIVDGAGRVAVMPIAAPPSTPRKLKVADWLVVAENIPARNRMKVLIARAAS